MSANDEKRFLNLIEIWEIIQKEEKYQDWKLHIVGDGDFKEILMNKIAQKNLQDSIILKPFTKEIDKEYLSASIYALTSRAEGLPTVLLEATSFGLPCIAFDILTGPSDIIEDCKSGFLIKDDDLQDFAKKLKILIDDEELRKKMGRIAKQISKEKFSKEAIMQQWLDLFNA